MLLKGPRGLRRRIRKEWNGRQIYTSHLWKRLFEKAFDSVHQESLWKIMESYRIPCEIKSYIQTCDNQFGFKKGHGTDSCIYIMKEVTNRYQVLGNTLYLCFLDASKSFNCVNHLTLINKPDCWSSNNFVKWGNVISDGFAIRNGVRQGGVLSSYLFNVYMDDLSVLLNSCTTGCYTDKTKVNHLMYTVDLVLMPPSMKGLNRLIKTCSEYRTTHDIRYNGDKSSVMHFAPRKVKNLSPSKFSIKDHIIQCQKVVQYLGHIINEDMSDDDDVNRQI